MWKGGKTSLAGITVENGGTLTLNGNVTIEIFNTADVIIAVGDYLTIIMEKLLLLIRLCQIDYI